MRPMIGVNGDCIWPCGDACHSPPSISAPRSHGKLRSMLTGTGVGSNFRFVADLELNETRHAPVAHPAIHPRTGRGDEARRALRSARAEPEHLETRVWGVSGPVRNRIKNRTERTEHTHAHATLHSPTGHTRAAQEDAKTASDRDPPTEPPAYIYIYPSARGSPQLQADQLCLLMIDATRARTTYYSTNPNLCAFCTNASDRRNHAQPKSPAGRLLFIALSR